MGHCSRTHGIKVSFTSEQCRSGGFKLRDCHTKAMAADVFTKYFVDPLAWQHALTLLGMFRFRPDQLTYIKPMQPSGGTWPPLPEESSGLTPWAAARENTVDLAML